MPSLLDTPILPRADTIKRGKGVLEGRGTEVAWPYEAELWLLCQRPLSWFRSLPLSKKVPRPFHRLPLYASPRLHPTYIWM